MYLPSNSEFLDSNTAARFTVELPKPIRCEGSGWEVAVKEVHYPVTWHNVPRSGCHIAAFVLGREYDASLAPGYYRTPNDLLSAIQRRVQHVVSKAIGNGYRSLTRMQYHTQSGRCTFEVEKNVVLVVNPHLSRMLGFGDRVTRLRQGATTSGRPLDISGGIDGLHIESDVVASYPVGIRQLPLLRIVPIPLSSVYGTNEYISYDPPMYMRLSKYEFSTISIAFTDGLGRPIPFAYGKTTVLLHFRRRQPQKKTAVWWSEDDGEQLGSKRRHG